MTEQEKREWLEWEANTDFNVRAPFYANNEYPTQNVAFMKDRNSPKLEEYITSHNGRWIHRGGIWCFTLPSGLMYSVVHAGNGARGYKPRRAIIDSDIDYDILWQVVIPCCHPVCRKMEII